MNNLYAITLAHPEFFILKQKIIFLKKLNIAPNHIRTMLDSYNLSNVVLKRLKQLDYPLNLEHEDYFSRAFVHNRRIYFGNKGHTKTGRFSNRDSVKTPLITLTKVKELLALDLVNP